MGIPKLHAGDFDGDGLQDFVYETGPYGGLDNTQHPLASHRLGFIKNRSSGTPSKLVDAGVASTITNVENIKHVVDFNGDGRTDIVITGTGQDVCQLYLSNSKPGDTGFSFKAPINVVWRVCSDVSWTTRILDLNGDSMQDILMVSQVYVDHVCSGPDGTGGVCKNIYDAYLDAYLYTGAGFSNLHIEYLNGGPLVSSPWALYENFAYSFAADYNTDGRMDLLIPNKSTGGTIRNDTGDTFLRMSLVQTGDPAIDGQVSTSFEISSTDLEHGNNDARYVIDITGDGRPDIVRVTSNNFITYINSPDESQPADTIFKIVSGLGTEYNITYSPLTDRWDRSNPSPLLQTGTYEKLNNAVTPRYRDFIAPLYVVSHVTSDVGGTDDGTLYRYSGGKIDTHGHGFLGFKETEAIHYYTISNTKYQKQRMVTQFEQEFPKTGQLASTTVYSSTGNRAVVTTNTWGFLTKTVLGGATSRFSYFPYLTRTQNTKYTENPNGGGSEVLESYNDIQYQDTNGNAIPYDNFGNVERISETRQGNNNSAVPSDPYLTSGDFTNQYITTTTNIYSNITTGANWHLGRLSSSTVQKSGPHTSEGTETRTSTFTYYSTDGLLNCETAQPGDVLSTTSCHQYDSYGNKTVTQVTGFDGSINDGGVPNTTNANKTRTTRVDYFVDGTTPNSPQYKIRTTNAKGHAQTDTIDATNGQVVASQGPNGLVTSYEYDALARLTKETLPDGAYTVTRYGAPCIIQPWTPVCDFVIEKQKYGSDNTELPVSAVFYDKLLRENMTWSSSFDEYVCTRKVYFTTGLHAGRIDYETEPYPCGSTSTFPKIEYDYDIRGNIRQVTYPDGRIDTTSENGVTRLGRKVTTSVRRNGLNGLSILERIAYFDSAGNLVKAIDDNDEAVRYIRNAYGTVVRTEHINSGNVIQTAETVTAAYDILGNRISLDDPDMGLWVYRYNAFGELKWQKDAKGQIKRLEYDDIGRILTKTEPDHMNLGNVTSEWTYDIGNKAVGKLSRVCVLRSATTCINETSNGEEYTYDFLGRPQTTTVKIEGQSYITTINSYDNLGRIREQTYPASGASNVRVRNVYNINGYLESVRDANSNNPFWTANEANIFDQVEQETFGNGTVTYKTYDPNNHAIASISTGQQGRYQDYEYSFDTVGNLERRIDNNEIISID
jgi:YD repeat-containing protein